MKKDKL